MPFQTSFDSSRRKRRRRKELATAGSSVSPTATVEEVLDRKASIGFGVRNEPGTTQPFLKTAAQSAAAVAASDLRYQVQTHRPIVSLAFVLPLILIYELCSIYWGGTGLRSGIDQWLDHIASAAGMGQLVILPLITTAILVVWHHRINDHWRFKGHVVGGMILESVTLGLILFCAARACNQIVAQSITTPTDTWLSVSYLFQRPEWGSAAIAAIGCGIYEELIFRLVLLLPAIWLVQSCCNSRRTAMIGGAILVSLVFTGLHYNIVNPAGEPIELGSFLFRFVASIIFCFLFLFRGFGIAVGTHVAYDILAQL